MCCWCLSINDTLESIQSKLKIIVVCAVILTIVLIAIKYWPETDSTGNLCVEKMLFVTINIMNQSNF